MFANVDPLVLELLKLTRGLCLTNATNNKYNIDGIIVKHIFCI